MAIINEFDSLIADYQPFVLYDFIVPWFFSLLTKFNRVFVERMIFDFADIT